MISFIAPQKNMPHACGVLVSEWLVVSGYCATRTVLGANPEQIENRVAFIEKTPRVRVEAFEQGSEDSKKWFYGDKGDGGSGNPEQEKTYGFDPESRRWCDEQLVLMGYVLPV